jgi:aryl-alcohol dehydrogenase-like predicted oxidoreductase
MAIYKAVGHSGLRVFPIGLGTMNFGWSADEARSFEIMDAYLAAGGNFIDTADIYSSWAGNGNAGGVSEEIIGRWVKARGVRDQVVIATKLRGAMGVQFSEGRDTVHQREGLSRRWILKSTEDSLRRLGTDYIDLMQVHWVDPETPIEETLSALTDLVRRGYIRYIGCSNFSAWRLMQALWASDKHGFERFVSIQPEYSLVAPVRQHFETEISKVCLEYGVGVVPYSPLAAGFLTGKYQRGAELPESVRAQGIQAGRMNDQNWTILDAVVKLAQAHETTPTRVALAWQLHKPFITAPIIGANTTAQLEDSLGAPGVQLSAEDMRALDEASGWQPARTELEQ